MKRFLLIVLIALAGPYAMATHIVGGEFEWVYKGMHPTTGNFRFQLGLILYFDNINGSPAAKDPSFQVRIFRKRDNVLMQTILLEYWDEVRVQYKRPACSTGSDISTNRIYYTVINGFTQGEVVLNPNFYDDPDGYYLAWERCCRNYTISNIYSEDPTSVGGRYAGQTFYLEFPPLKKNGNPFINSSPTLFQPLSDYACKDRLYRVNFAGTDYDGDSLVYSMATPLNTHTADALPAGNVPGPGPYPTVNYRPGFSSRNIMGGNPDLNITRDGMLTVIPSRAGLFVFAVKVEEFRNGVKIGEVRRDFQMLVLANCPPSSPPIVEGKRKTDSQYVRNNLTLTFDQDAVDEARCIEIRVTDPDAATGTEDIEILALAVGFENDHVNDILPENPKVQLSNGNAALFSICFPQCPYTDGTYTIDIIALNESCGGARMDTIRVDVTVNVLPNSAPVFDPQFVTKTIDEGGAPYVVQFTARDDDNDNLIIIPPTQQQIDLAKYGFTYEEVSNAPGELISQLTWDTQCNLYDFSVKRDFLFKFIVDDQDVCNLTPNDTIIFDLKRRINDFHDPVIEYVPDPTLEKVTITKKLYETLSFEVDAYDVDVEDILVLSGEGVDFSLPAYGAVFPTQTFNERIRAPFHWFLDCSKIDLNDKDEFQFYLIVKSREKFCGYDLADTLDVTVKVMPPDNIKPIGLVDGQSDGAEFTLTLGEELVLPIAGVDGDTAPKDRLTLELISAQGDGLTNYTFEAESPSLSPVLGTFRWKPMCDVFSNNIYENEYQFTFLVKDDRCFNPMKDSVSFRLIVKDIENDPADFLPPNVITPTDDNDKNEYFALEKVVAGERVSILPKDNCRGRFVGITIVNRWGRKVYESSSRDFRWYADNEPGGVYFYLLKYTDKEYKGTISVVDGGSQSVNR